MINKNRRTLLVIDKCLRIKKIIIKAKTIILTAKINSMVISSKDLLKGLKGSREYNIRDNIDLFYLT